MVDKIEAVNEAERMRAIGATDYLKDRVVLLEKYLKTKDTRSAREEIRHIESTTRNINLELDKQCWKGFN